MLLFAVCCPGLPLASEPATRSRCRCGGRDGSPCLGCSEGCRNFRKSAQPRESGKEGKADPAAASLCAARGGV